MSLFQMTVGLQPSFEMVVGPYHHLKLQHSQLLFQMAVGTSLFLKKIITFFL
jgi:hypothetical protein